MLGLSNNHRFWWLSDTDYFCDTFEKLFFYYSAKDWCISKVMADF
jgi:hypothetical protein